MNWNDKQPVTADYLVKRLNQELIILDKIQLDKFTNIDIKRLICMSKSQSYVLFYVRLL
jgi:hypothetical protein